MSVLEAYPEEVVYLKGECKSFPITSVKDVRILQKKQKRKKREWPTPCTTPRTAHGEVVQKRGGKSSPKPS